MTLLNKIYYVWRVVGTGFAFALFGLGGPIIAVGVSLIVLLTPTKASKCRMARTAVRYAFKMYVRLLRVMGLLTFEVKGEEHIPTDGQLLIANHPSLLDVVFLMSVVKDSSCIVKQGLFKNPFTRLPITAAKFICNGSSELVDHSVDSLDTGTPLIVFPEGTRTVPGEPMRFQRGAANIALAAKCNIVPAVIECHPATLIKNEKWYQVPKTPPHFTIEFRKPIEIQPYVENDQPQCKTARVLTRDLVDYFTFATQPSAQGSNVMS